MELTPNDIRNYEFPTQLRGYEKDAVEEFAEQVATALEGAKQDNLKLSMEIDSLKSQLTGLKQFEDTIKNAAIDARRNADMTISNAKEEAELIVKKAKNDAQKAREAHSQRVSDIEEKIHQLELTKKSYMTKLRSLITSHLDIVDEIAQSEPSLKKESSSIEVTESSEVEAITRETIATPPCEPKPIRTEEANAAGEIVAVEPETEEQEPSPSEAGLDPELAAALESYQAKQQEAQSDSQLAAMPPAPAPGEIVETTARAEDIPPGFIARTEGENSKITDKIKVSSEKQTDPNEPNRVNIDSADNTASDPEQVQDLASSLDEVVAKVEEEIEKAEKS